MSVQTLESEQLLRPIVSPSQAKILVETIFGLQVQKISELNSYDDKNFYVEVSDGRKFNLKVLNSLETKRSYHVDAEHEMMFKLSSRGINCPVPVKTSTGKLYEIVTMPEEDNINQNATGQSHLVRLLSFVEGTILHSVPITSSLFRQCGSEIAKIQKILSDLNGKLPLLESYTAIWLLACFPNLTRFIHVIKDHAHRFNLVESVLNSYKTSVQPLIPSLERGVIHGDYNEQNIIVQESNGEWIVSGLIDFGDAHIGPYVFELAITMSYMMIEALRLGNMDPFEAAGHVVAGYNSVRKVPEHEFKMLRTLVAARISTSVVMGAYTHSLEPSNDYVLTTGARGWTLLDQIWNKSEDQFVSICKQFL